MKPYTPGDRLTLTDADGNVLGTTDVDAVDGAVVLGTFLPGPGFRRVAGLFREFEDLVEAAALGVLPEIERRIAALSLRVGRAGEPSTPAGDVQIYSDGGFSCRPVGPAAAGGPAARAEVHSHPISHLPGER